MAAGGQTRTIQKLQMALKCEGEIISIATSEFYSVDKDKMVKRYFVKRQIQDPDNKFKSTMEELFSSCSMIEVTLFLRDLYYEKKGWEIPTDNPVWEERKKKYFGDGE